MSHQNPPVPHPDYNVDTSLAKLHIAAYHPALASDATQAQVMSLEEKYLHAIDVLQERNVALTSQRDAAVGDAQHFHDENERLVKEVTSLKDDVECQEILLRAMKKELEKKGAVGVNDGGDEEMEEGEVVEKVVVVFADVLPGAEKKMGKWAGVVGEAARSGEAPWRV